MVLHWSRERVRADDTTRSGRDGRRERMKGGRRREIEYVEK